MVQIGISQFIIMQVSIPPQCDYCLEIIIADETRK